MRSAPIVCSEESPLPASVYDNYAVRRFAAGGLVRRLWLGSGIWCPMGFSPASVPEGFQRASGKPFGAPADAYPLSRTGIDAPTTAREWNLPFHGALTLFFAKEKCAKESQRHGDSGKKALIAHFAGGARYVARTLIGKISLAIVRAPNSPFSAVKMGGPFSLRCLSPLCSPAVGAGQTQMMVLGMLRCGEDGFAARKDRLNFLLRLAASILKQRWLGYFDTAWIVL